MIALTGNYAFFNILTATLSLALIEDRHLRYLFSPIRVFKSKTKLPGGMYFFFLPSRSTFDILISDNQTFTVENDTTDLLKNIKVTGDKENQIFIDNQRYFAEQRKKTTALTDEYKASTDEAKKKEIEKQFSDVNSAVNKHIDEIIAANPGFFFSKFLKATQEVIVPQTIKDQKDQYYYYRNHYFQNFDYKDQRLLRTPIYENKLDYYLDKVIPQAPDSIIPEVDVLINNSRHDKELFRYMLVHLFQKYGNSQLMGSENVYVHIAEKFYINDADWSDKKFIDELKATVARKKPALIGNIAPDLKLLVLPADTNNIISMKELVQSMKEKGDEILKNEASIKEKTKSFKANYPNLTDSAAHSQVIISELASILDEQLIPKFESYMSVYAQKTRYTILYFWEPDCSHCKEETPKFSKAYDENKLKERGVTVVAVYLQKNINEWPKYTNHINLWLDFVLKNNMSKWINVWDPFGTSQYRDKYDISSTPVIYLLDKDKKIIAKRIAYDQALSIIDELEKNENKK